MLIDRIVERDDIADYLEKHGLTKQYIKATENLLAGNYLAPDLKKRKPKQDGIWQFRITKKYRAYCYLSGDTLVVFEVDDHQ